MAFLHWLPCGLHRAPLASQPPRSQTRDVDTSCAVPAPTTILQGAQFHSVGDAVGNPLSKHYGRQLLWGCHANNLGLPTLLKSANTKFTATSTFNVNMDVIKFR